jgi:hypothetical protein
VTAKVCTEEPLRVGQEARAILTLADPLRQPLEFKDLREVHEKKIHLLIIDSSLTDYHHEHPQPGERPGEYTFRFTPRTEGPYRAWADVQPLATGFQEYAAAEVPGLPATGRPVEKTYPRRGEDDGIRAELRLESETVKAGAPVPASVKVWKGRVPETELEPLMGAFAHLVGFHENWKDILHMHPMETRVLKPEDRGGPELEFRIYADTPGYYRFFLQVQVDGDSKFIPFGVDVVP